MNALRAVGLGLILILMGMAIAVSMARWPLGVTVVLAGLALVLFWGLFDAWKGRQSLPTRPRDQETR